LYTPGLFLQNRTLAAAALSGFVQLGSAGFGYGVGVSATLAQVGFGFGNFSGGFIGNDAGVSALLGFSTPLYVYPVVDPDFRSESGTERVNRAVNNLFLNVL
jgi:hypothetical protein